MGDPGCARVGKAACRSPGAAQLNANGKALPEAGNTQTTVDGGSNQQRRRSDQSIIAPATAGLQAQPAESMIAVESNCYVSSNSE